MLYQSTTPTIRLHIKNEDFDMTTIDACHLTIENDSGRNKLVFKTPDIDTENKIISQTLTQEETLALETGCILLQLKVKCGDTVIASRIIRTTLNDILEKEPLEENEQGT